MANKAISVVPADFRHEFKPVKILPGEEKQKTWLGKHVKWLKEERQGWSKIGVTAFQIFETAVLAVSVIGLLVLRQELLESRRQDAKAEYFRRAAQANPPSDSPIKMKSKTRTFNHVQEFAIEDGILWMRLWRSQDQWKPIYFDGFAEGRIPVSLDSDGANLIVLDETNAVHYKKVLKEFRQRDVNGSNRHRLEKAGANLATDQHMAFNNGEKDNWKDKWFSLPYLHYLVNLFTGKRLRIPADAKAWAISQRGRYNDYLEDPHQHQHPVTVGVTTLYVLDKNGKDIYKFDPWSPKHVKVSIPLPETSDMTFEAENISVSASMIMAIGYETQKDTSDQRTLQIYTRLADIDSEGWNPGLKYDYFDHPHDPEVRIVGQPEWTSHSLKLAPGDFITKAITVVQTGAGNNERELRVAGQHDGQKGFFFKKVNEEEWQFEAMDDEDDADDEISSENALPLEIVLDEGDFQTTVHDYVGSGRIKSEYVSAHLSNFGQRSYYSKFEVTINQKPYTLELYKKKTLKNFIGLEGDSYELVIPEKLHQNRQFMRLFKGKKVIPIQVKQHRNQWVLQGSNIHFTFTQQA